MTYEDLLKEADREGLIVKEKALQSADGLIRDNRIAIRNSIPTTIEKACVLAEELGHYHTAIGNILDLKDVNNMKQELKGRIWGYDRQIGLLGIIKAFERGCQSRYEIAEYLGITEKYLEEAINYYRSKYGVHTTIDRYIIYFIPNLSVAKLF